MARIGFAPSLTAPLSIQDLTDLALAAEKQGYESFWMAEGSGKDSISQLSVLAARTNRIKLATGILNTYSRSPSLIAMTAASLDDISQGRFVLGLGAGHKQTMESNHGVTFQKPTTLMRDYVSIIKGAFKGEQMSYKGEAWSVGPFTLGARLFSPTVPVYVATLGGPMAEVAGEVADGVLPFLASPEGIQELLDSVKRGAERAGRNLSDIDVACFIVTASGDDSLAEAEARTQISRYARLPFYQRMLTISGFASEVEKLAAAWAAGDGASAPALVSDRMLECLALVGNPRGWPGTIKRFLDAGVKLPIIYASTVGDDPKGSLMQTVASINPDRLS